MFDWDEENIQHIALHGVTPAEAEQVFMNDPTDGIEEDHDGEIRFNQIGVTEEGRCLVVITTWREDKLRVVTAFTAPPALKRLYFGRN